MHSRPVKNLNIATIIAYILLPMSGFAVDIYLPSLPQMVTDLHTSQSLVQMSISIFLLSYGVTQVGIGTILDRHGRYIATIISIIIFSLSCLIISLTNSIYVILLCRLIHGICIGIFAVSTRAFFIDCYSGDKLKSHMSMFSIIWSAGPIIAPFLGGYLETSFGWRSNFLFLAIYSLVIVICYTYYSGETIKQKHSLNIKSILATYRMMLATPQFLLGIIILGSLYGMVMMYSMSGPFILEHTLGLSPVITGYSSLALGVAWMLGGIINKNLLNYPMLSKAKYALLLQSILIVTLYLSGIKTQLLPMLTCVFLIHICAGFMFNIFFGYCLSYFPHIAATASGLTGGGFYLITSLTSYSIVNGISIHSQQNLSVGYLLLFTILATAVGALNKIIARKH